MGREEDLEKIPDIIDEKPWLILLLMDRKPLIIERKQYLHALKIAYNVAKHLRKKDARVGLLITILMALLGK